MAKAERLDAIMWDNTDTNAARELLEAGRAAARRNPPYPDVAAFAFADVAVFIAGQGNQEEAEALARETLKFAAADCPYERLRMRMWALDLLARICKERGASKEREEFADQLLATLQAPVLASALQKRRALDDFLWAIWGGYDPFHLPEKSVRRAIQRLDPRDKSTRTQLQAILGGTVARQGNWREGLVILQGALDESVHDTWLWRAAIDLAALLGDSATERMLSMSSLALSGGQPDGERSSNLVEPMLIRTPDPALLPTIRRLVGKAAQGPPWSRVLGKLPQALFEYHSGHYDQAGRLIEQYLEEGPVVLGGKMNEHWACGWFVRAMIDTKLSRHAAARDAYQQALKLHSVAM